jgi:LysR family carnitine catabolism transcriptional activator
MINFTAKQLRAFQLVAQHRSFSRAAGSLFITPAGLSILIRQLEAQLGTRLFDRTTRQVALTTSGIKLLDVVQRTLHDVETAVSEVGRSEAVKHASFSIGAPPLLAQKMLAPAIKEFRRTRPEFRFQLFDGDSAATMQKVEAGELDMGMGVFFKHMPGVRRTPMFRFFLTLIQSGEGSAPSPATVRWSSLKGTRLIALPASLPLQNFINKNLARAGVERPPSLVVNYLTTQIGMVEAGEGAAIIPSYWNIDRSNRGLRMSRLVNPVAHLDFCQIRRSGRRLPMVAGEFTAFVRHYIAAREGKAGAL